MNKNKVLLSLGSNLGNKKINLQSALSLIDKKIGDVVSISKIYQTPALGFVGEEFYNCCIAVKTDLLPLDLLKKIIEIEKVVGRLKTKYKTYESRTIDIDILFYENQVIKLPELQIPHPRLHQRAFVIIPLLDIAKSKVHPILKTTILDFKNNLTELDSIQELELELKIPIMDLMNSFDNIVIEGNIGVGKTTLSKKLSVDLNKNLILEEFKENPFLEKFYKDSRRYALNLELTFLIDRCRQLNDFKNQMDLFKPGVVFDYDIFKSLIFAGVTLSEIDFKLFRDIYYFMTKDLYKSNLVVYLLQKTEKLLSNINNRGREYEKDISKDYLDKINNAYINYLKNRQDLNIVFIDISDLDFVENHIDYLELLNRIKRKLR